MTTGRINQVAALREGVDVAFVVNDRIATVLSRPVENARSVLYTGHAASQDRGLPLVKEGFKPNRSANVLVIDKSDAARTPVLTTVWTTNHSTPITSRPTLQCADRPRAAGYEFQTRALGCKACDRYCCTRMSFAIVRIPRAAPAPELCAMKHV